MKHVRVVGSKIAGELRFPKSFIELIESGWGCLDDFLALGFDINPKKAKKALEILAKDEDSSVRCKVAGYSNTPVVILEILAKDERSNVRSAVAGNSNTPAGTLEILAKDEDEDVRNESILNSLTHSPLV